MRYHDAHLTDEDLLRVVDRELSPYRMAGAERHLESCTMCRVRYEAIESVAGDVKDLWKGDASVVSEASALSREQFERALHAAADRLERSGTRALLTGLTLVPRWAPLALASAAAVLFFSVRYESALMHRSLILERQVLPLASLTPGAVRPVTAEEVCAGALDEPPPIPDAVRLQVLRDYGMEHVPAEEYELDYLITPELGGVPDPRNLWPERYRVRSWNAHVKDALEHALPRLMCEGRIDLRTAQREIATNWVAAYKKYLNTDQPLPLNARLFTPPTEPTRDW